jgi:hypothetical protein
MRGVLVALALGGLLPFTGLWAQQSGEPYPGLLDEHPAIQYDIRPVHDRVAQLDAELRRGTRTLKAEGQGRYLRAVLDALQVPAASQLLVFSKTGIQGSLTGPRTPRALYYDAEVVVGYIPGARALELAAHDPEQGVVFYTLDQASAAAPTFERRTNCVTCHVSGSTLEVPGMLVRSHDTSADGNVLFPVSQAVSHRTPLSERWGGWFVTGRYTAPPYAGVLHRGNTTLMLHPTSGPAITSNEVWIEWMAGTPETDGYLSGSSDIASLLIFDHQMHAINLLTRVNWEARVAAATRRAEADDPILRPLIDELTDYLVFVDEVPPPARVLPPPGFTEQFAARGVRDRRGRTLRELDLDQRLLRYPCSYMIESAAFDRLPPFVRRAIYQRLTMILQSSADDGRYAHLTRDDRRAVLEILSDIKPDFQGRWGR